MKIWVFASLIGIDSFSCNVSNLETPNSAEPRFAKPYRFTCTQCGKCCSSPDTIVNLTYSDILRMEFEQGYTLADFLNYVGFYIFEEEPTADQLKKMVLPPIKTQRGPAFLGLRKTNEGKCIFLSKKNRCKIYSARPNICRTFPFHFHSAPVQGDAPGLDISMNIAQKAYEYCPGFSKENPAIDPDEWMALGKETMTNILKEVILINKWNKAIEENKITPSAENFLRIVLNMANSPIEPGNKTNNKVSYKTRIKRKLQTKERE